MEEISSEEICKIIVCNMFLNSKDNSENIIYMKELATRRSLGEVFDFETCIDNLKQEIPNVEYKVNFNFDMIKGAISQ